MWRTIKYAFRLLRENPVLSIVSMLGTALAIGTVMMLEIAETMPTTNFYPAMHRERMLFVKTGNAVRKDDSNSQSNSYMSEEYAQALKGIASAEAVTMTSRNAPARTVRTPGATEGERVQALGTDEDFWCVYDFDFVHGHPYGHEDVESNTPCVVIGEALALHLFGRTDVVGQSVEVDFVPCQIRGVVRDVNTYLEDICAEVWYPYPLFADIKWHRVCGEFSVTLLARSADELPQLRQAVIETVDRFNESLGDYEYMADLRGQPDDAYSHNLREFSNWEPDTAGHKRQHYVLVGILLLLPAVNLASVAHARMMRRLMELGVRKAFGASRWRLVRQVMVESTLQTLLGGILGLLLSYGAAYALRGVLLGSSMLRYVMGLGDDVIPIEVLLSPRLFGWLLVFCLVLNLIVSLIPAIRASRRSIVYSLNVKK